MTNAFNYSNRLTEPYDLEGMMTYSQAKHHVQRVKSLLRGSRNLEHYISEAQKDLNKLSTLAAEVGKEQAILSFKEVRSKDFETEYDRYYASKVTELSRAKHLYDKVQTGMSRIKNSLIRDILEYSYVDCHDVQDTADHFAFSVSSVSRYKKQGLISLVQSIYGVVIVDEF